ncbi:MAG: DNA replication/repair protein RecF [candidate division Zixibacteria bacterium]|nr:DNA replication/repair protein RecF [candidate division Zixibacteria bacterium]NIS45415.1 DNA replication/repair protein RecF [candidate division Zixibacteria bacterium]NIT53960.1 DNA replication/repair protein RecF [candidate division Zixibacteria bacterium]NIV05570.1 DNA replication/repair protein RecF [candidate division Zixibacteria bacterium]NIW39897.1 DNA replication/repair protein RecF [candidate division Zixibacteria bacterium]
MFIENLKLAEFRNLKKAEIEFSPKNNLIVGPNGSGKTNILEALFYTGSGRSFRTHLDENLVNTDSEFFRIEAAGRIGNHEVQIEIGVEPGKRKIIKVNSGAIRKLGELFEYFRLVEFSPYDLEIIIGSPSVRRRYISITISQLDPPHVSVLSDYHKTLAQRNALLKSFEETPKLSASQEASLAVWDEKLAIHAVQIHESRKKYIEKIANLSADFYRKISGLEEYLKIEYNPSPNLDEFTSQHFCERLASRRQREIALGQTMYGPHRDDLKFYIDSLEAKNAGSQGQIKTAVLSLKLAQYDYLQETLEKLPIILLDEIFSDLDRKRLDFVMNLLPELGQSFMTTSKLSEVNNLDIFNSKFNVEKGIPTSFNELP